MKVTQANQKKFADPKLKNQCTFYHLKRPCAKSIIVLSIYLSTLIYKFINIAVNNKCDEYFSKSKKYDFLFGFIIFSVLSSKNHLFF